MGGGDSSLISKESLDTTIKEPLYTAHITRDGIVLAGGKNGLRVANSPSSKIKNKIAGFNNLKISGKHKLSKNEENKAITFIETNPVNIYAIAEQQDGKIIIGGNFGFINDIARNSIARLNPDGTLDESFGNGMNGVNGEVYDIKIQDDGKILVGGYFTQVNDTPAIAIARLENEGSVDLAFNISSSGIFGIINTIEVFNDKIFIGGSFETKNNYKNILIIIAGDITCIEDMNVSAIARINSDGSLDKSFVSNEIEGYIFTTYITQAGDILVGGDFDLNSDYNRSSFALINKNGVLQKSFNTIINGDIYEFLELGEFGAVLISGEFSEVNAKAANNISLINIQ